MLKYWIFKLHESANLQQFFYAGEFIIACLFIIILWFIRPKNPESNFKVRESDRPHPRVDEKKKIPLFLPGIRLDGAAHEILGVPPNADLNVVQKSYRDLMKRYHPDRIDRPGTQAWKDAQKIAEAINRAKEEMVKKLQKK
jgi:DnaJ domain